jgi:tRNA uridine 5-carboxymethylaminomethyl modification enzyme
MKTGTPARIDVRSLNLEKFERQDGDAEPCKFSFLGSCKPVEEQMPCYLVYTSQQVHDTLRTGFADSPLFQGLIKGIGPRYCPSIEDKLRTFADKDFHQLFLEPEGRDTNEYYLNGFSSSLPWQVQCAALEQIEGFENVRIYRPGYAIEYDYFPPTQLTHTLETKLIGGLYFAGQVNGTTGYEEAAAQGLMAGINAVRKLRGEGEVVLSRDEAYIGVLIDDLVTKGVDEPYRMFTSRAEYRILLRQDNADRRLTPIGREIGLVSDERWAEFEQKKSLVESLKNFIHAQGVAPEEISDYLKSVDSAQLSQKRKVSEVLMRNNISLFDLIELISPLKKFVEKNNIGREIIEQVEIEVKYSGYIVRERANADKLKRLEDVKIPEGFDFLKLTSITIEARQKLSKIRPTTVGQASRIPGVSPADINVLLIFFGR